ncbi:hypothetical protein VMCG_09010 [Cytospora schulzeri]|uniref:Protein kinase domain-containing protein n=1 Tax=Cytospora schulzeri TaxID=448051 RepID=A0A423VPK8_9PEZI|nr:hypothetical protein VMCG_09010 [Valsa malicola]
MAAQPALAAPPPAPAPPAVAGVSAAIRQSVIKYSRLVVQEQKYDQLKFSLYRNGDPNFRWSLGSMWRFKQRGDRELWDRMQARDIPRPTYRGVFKEVDRVSLQAIATRMKRYFDAPRQLLMLSPTRMDDARREVRRAGQIMNNTFRFIKYLGSGGNGMKTFMTRLLRAPHILQRFIIKDNLPQVRSRRVGPGIETMAQALDNDDGFLFMGYARFGDLDKLLRKTATAERDGGVLLFPNPALWRFLDCLVKGCIAMDYPPREVPANIPNNVPPGAPAPSSGPNLPETMPPGALAGNVPGHAGIVHFDLDPTNVFVGDFDRIGPNAPVPVHTDAPRLQIADFGLAETGEDLWVPANPPGSSELQQVKRRLDMWRIRRQGKQRWFLPIMYCLMTFTQPQFPPVAGRLAKDEPPGMPYGLVARSEQRWTYGFRLVDPDPANASAQEFKERYGSRLCEVVARCLMNKQAHRPSLQQLQDWITTAITPPPGGGDPPGGSTATALYAGWKRTVFGNPPFPKVPRRVSQTRLGNMDIDPFWDYGRDRPLSLR